jgi:hypothetical protein
MYSVDTALRYYTGLMIVIMPFTLPYFTILAPPHMNTLYVALHPLYKAFFLHLSKTIPLFAITDVLRIC